MTASSNPDGNRRRQRSDGALNRTRLVLAAQRMLAEDREAGVAEIAAAAGVARSTAYRHFPSREDLVEAVRRQARDDAEASEDQRLRPPGQLAHHAPTPLSITEVLNKVPPFQLGEQIVAEAQRLDGVTAAAVYLCDLDGTMLQRMAGPATFPRHVAVPLAVGPEIPREGVSAVREAIDQVLPDTIVAPLFLRGRAIGMLVALGAADDALRDLAAEAAAAIALADEYTDAIDEVRRVRPTSPAAEIQQNLLPPRILRIGGALIAGNVLPGYDLGGDWFDYAENEDCTWVGIADTEGTGPRAAGLGAVILGAFRAARHGSDDPAEIVDMMHSVLCEVSGGTATATCTIAAWNGPRSTVRWLTCGEHAPVVISGENDLEVLGEGVLPALGEAGMPADKPVQERRLDAGERLMLISDGIIDRATLDGGRLGLDGVRDAVAKAPNASASGTLRAVEDAVREAVQDPLSDDATLVVLVPHRTVLAEGL